jgi:MFS family permease
MPDVEILKTPSFDYEQGSRGVVGSRCSAFVLASKKKGSDMVNDVEVDGEKKDLTRAYVALGVLFATFASNQWSRQAIYYLCDFTASADAFKHMNAALNFDKEMYATLASIAFTLVFAVVSLFAGTASDRYDRSRVAALSCLAWSACTALQSQASSYGDLIPLRALTGFSQAFFNPAAYTLLSDLFPARMIGTVNGIFSGGVYLGGALASLSILLDGAYGWRSTVQTIGLIGAGAAVLCFLLVPEPRSSSAGGTAAVMKKNSDKNLSATAAASSAATEMSSSSSKGSNPVDEGLRAIREVSATREARLLLSATALRFCAGFSIAIWKAPFIFNKFPGVAEQFSSSNAAIVAGGGLLSTLVGGYVSDRLTNPSDPESNPPKARAWVPAVGSLLAAPAWAAFILAPTPELTAAALLIEYLVAECWFGPTLAALFTVVSPERRGAAQGLFSVLTALGNTAPILIGAFAGGNLGDYQLSNVLLYAVSGCYVMAGALFWLAALEDEKRIAKTFGGRGK